MPVAQGKPDTGFRMATENRDGGDVDGRRQVHRPAVIAEEHLRMCHDSGAPAWGNLSAGIQFWTLPMGQQRVAPGAVAIRADDQNTEGWIGGGHGFEHDDPVGVGPVFHLLLGTGAETDKSLGARPAGKYVCCGVTFCLRQADDIWSDLIIKPYKVM